MRTRDIRKSKIGTIITTWLCLLVGITFSVHAQSPDDQYWSDEFSVGGVAGIPGSSGVLETHTSPDGMYVGGIFTAINGVATNSVALFDGTNWQPLGEGISYSGSVGLVSAIYTEGNKVYVAGLFDHAGSVPANNIAVYNTDTEAWSALGTGTSNGTDGQISVLKKVGSKLYVGGDYANAGGNSINNIGYWDGTSWNALGSGTDGNVLDIEVINNEIYATGDFANAGGNAAANMAIWDGSAWSEFEGGASGKVYTIAAIDTSIYVGGDFSSVDGNTINNIGRWDGTNWNALSTEPNNQVRSIKDTPDGILVAGGFDQVGILEASGIARWSGTTWEVPNELLVADFAGTAIVVSISEYNGDYVIGGTFNRSESNIFNYIASLNSSLQLSAFHTGSAGKGIAGNIEATAESNGDLYVGGLFGGTNTVTAQNIVKWDGSAWSALGEGVDGPVGSILVDGNKVYVAGDFANAGSVPANNIAVWDTSTESWSALGTGTNNDVLDLLKQGSKIYAAGSFTQAGGNSANYIAVWDGTTWSNLGSGTDNDINSIAYMQGSIIAAGDFSTAGGNSANNIAKWNGSSWSALAAGTDAEIRDLTIVGDSVLYAAGDFSNADGNPAKKVAMWDGTNWEALGVGLDNTVYALTYNDGVVYAGGKFENSGVAEIAGIASWEVGGSSWKAVGSGLTGFSGSEVHTMNVSQDDHLIVGGLFNEVGNKAAFGLSMYDLTETPVSNERQAEIASDFTLQQNYPNPFNPTTNITYKVPSQSPVTLKVYNMLGQQVSTLVNGVKAAGSHTVSFDASNLSSGMYIYRLTAANTSITRKMMLLK